MSDQSVMDRYAAMPGRYFDDFKEGDIYHHLPAMGTSVERTAGQTPIHKLGEGYDMPNRAVDGTSQIQPLPLEES